MSWMPMFRTIAVGTDGKESADRAIGVALVIAERYQARLLILSVDTATSPKQL
jgi:nucleotide-binding universal stress UspA family protein